MWVSSSDRSKVSSVTSFEILETSGWDTLTSTFERSCC